MESHLRGMHCAFLRHAQGRPFDGTGANVDFRDLFMVRQAHHERAAAHRERGEVGYGEDLLSAPFF